MGNPGGPLEDATIPRTMGRYAIVRSLGRGAMGAVYLAHDTTLDRMVALKIPHLSPDSSAQSSRFRREATSAASLNHPNLCQVYDVGSFDGVDYLTMRFVSGDSLAERLVRTGAMPESEASRLVCVVAEAMEVAHQSDVIHRDLKPANILFNEHDEPVVVDFGLARRGAPADASINNPGTILGTPTYMPPEQFGSDAVTQGPAGDIYSLGVILYELLAGQVPFRGTAGSVFARLLTEEPLPPAHHRPGLDPRLEAVCLRAMDKKPANRFASMAEFAAALRPFANAESLRPVTVSIPPTARVGRKWLVVAMGLVGLIAIAGLAMFKTTWFASLSEMMAGRPADSFRVNNVWEGRFRYLGSDEDHGGLVLLTIIERHGATFSATYLTEGKYQWQVDGDAHDGTVRWKLTKPLNEAARALVTGVAVEEGKYDAEKLTATYVDADSRAQIDLRLRR